MNTPAVEVVRLAARPVERRSPLPAWAQVDRDLRRLIERDLEVGAQLPTERDLAELYGVSRITIRQALSGLEADGFLERRQGSGTFVADRPEMVQHDFGLTSPWRERFAASGHEATSVVEKGLEGEPQPFELVRLLREGEATLPFHHLKRAHQVDGRAIGVTDSWVNLEVAPDLPTVELVDTSLSRTLAEKFGISDVTWHHHLEAGIAGADDAKLLHTNVGGQVIVIWSLARTPEGRLIETTRTQWLASRVRFHYVAHQVFGA
ncbi:GntR family transcriptional regulator [Tessaracoccus lapidicaptus]|uniref:GntR family transcriptional regulator n=1 Tax=Tessaracoccus lapidicaptus TaxID=1427523 RepID=UPI00333ECA58